MMSYTGIDQKKYRFIFDLIKVERKTKQLSLKDHLIF